MQAVQFDQYGGTDVLRISEGAIPEVMDDSVLVRVRAAGINPVEGRIRRGELHDRWPATFPSGQGSDFAGTIEAVGDAAAGWAPGDDVIGFTNDRASHAELVAVPLRQLVAKPAAVSWAAAGALFVAGTTAYATVRAVAVTAGDIVVVSGAAGGVGSLAAQLAVDSGATVIGIASPQRRSWLQRHGVIHVEYGPGVLDRIRAAGGGRLDALIDTAGPPYVRLAVELGIRRDRINTVTDAQGLAEFGVKAQGNESAADAATLAFLADLIAHGRLEVPIAASYPMSEVQAAYRDLEQGHTFGKIVLIP